MKFKTSIIFIILSSLGIYLLYYNFDVRNIDKFNLLLNISSVSIIIGIVGFIIYLIAKESRKIKTNVIGLLIISLAISSYVGFYKYQINKTNEILSEYYELKTCKKMENRFTIDLKNNEIKYFQFGIGTDLALQQTLKTKYGIESYGMDCLVTPEFDCYNQLVNNYLKEKYNDRIIDY